MTRFEQPHLFGICLRRANDDAANKEALICPKTDFILSRFFRHIDKNLSRGSMDSYPQPLGSWVCRRVAYISSLLVKRPLKYSPLALK